MREAYRDWIDIQLVAFPQSGVVTEDGAPDLMAAALRAGADLVGGLDPAGFDGDVKGQLDIVFGLAERFGKGIDIHLHDGGETGAAELCEIAERTIAAGMQGRVAVSHAFALGTIAPRLFEETADRLARAEVAIMTSCPPSAPVPPVGALRERGVTVFAGSDNIRDCWSPFGNGDMLDRAAIIAERHEMFTDRELEDAFALATREADKALGDPRRGLHVGAVADLVAVEAASIADAVVERPPRSLVLRAGRVAAERGVSVRGACLDPRACRAKRGLMAARPRLAASGRRRGVPAKKRVSPAPGAGNRSPASIATALFAFSGLSQSTDNKLAEREGPLVALLPRRAPRGLSCKLPNGWRPL